MPRESFHHLWQEESRTGALPGLHAEIPGKRESVLRIAVSGFDLESRSPDEGGNEESRKLFSLLASPETQGLRIGETMDQEQEPKPKADLLTTFLLLGALQPVMEKPTGEIPSGFRCTGCDGERHHAPTCRGPRGMIKNG